MNKQWLQKLKPEIPTAFPANQGIRIEEAAGADDIKVKIFSATIPSFFPAQKCFEDRCQALRTFSMTTALGAI